MLDLKYKNLHKFDIEMDFKIQVKKNQFSNGAWLGFRNSVMYLEMLTSR